MSDVEQVVLAELVSQQAAQLPDLPLLTFVNVAPSGEYQDETRTYRELHNNGQTLAKALVELGVHHGDKVALMMNNHPEFVESMVATSTIGATFVPIDPRTMGAKLAYMLDFTDCCCIVCADYAADAVLAVVDQCPQLQWMLVVATGHAWSAPDNNRLAIRDFRDALQTASSDELPIVEQSLDEPMFMMFTSGTTGNPKAVVNTHRKYLSSARSLGAILQKGDKLYSGLSLTHINAQNTLSNSLALGVPAVFSRKFSKSRLWDICRRYRCTLFNLLGGMIPEVYAAPERPDDADNPVRVIFSSGMPASIWEKFMQRFGVILCEGYGATEGGGMTNPMGSGPVGSIGRPAPGLEAAILDADDNRCPPNVEGEICFRRLDGQPIVVEYYKNPGTSAEKIRNGWLRMGDLGHYDENGWFYFHHRVGGGVRRNGDFVNTTLVETVLAKSPLVADVFVYGVATAKNVAGEKTLVAAVVPSNSDSFDSSALLGYCRQNLERNDVPEIIQVLDEIPKTISEKPIESICAEWLARAGFTA
jgi:crotonobetaine/carnitine-CoA ligase